MTEIYSDPIIKKYIDLIRGVVGDSKFKGVYQGDPIRVPVSNLPALIIAKSETRISNAFDGGDSANDAHFVALTVTVITDIRDQISEDKNIAPGISELYDIIEGREADTLKLKTTSLLHILRHNIQVDQALGLRTDIGSITRADYGLTIGKRAEEAWATEAQLEFIAHFTQLR